MFSATSNAWSIFWPPVPSVLPVVQPACAAHQLTYWKALTQTKKFCSSNVFTVSSVPSVLPTKQSACAAHQLTYCLQCFRGGSQAQLLSTTTTEHAALACVWPCFEAVQGAHDDGTDAWDAWPDVCMALFALRAGMTCVLRLIVMAQVAIACHWLPLVHSRCLRLIAIDCH